MSQAKSLPASFRRIRLELAREPGHPAGDRGVGYTLVAPLQPDGKLDAEAAAAFKQHCSIIRFDGEDEPVHGILRRRPGGSWAFHYDFADGAEDDDPGYRLGEHRFVAGEYVTIDEDEGRHTYRVASVESV